MNSCLLVYFQLQRLIKTLKFEILDQTFAHFNRFEGSFMAILAVEKALSKNMTGVAKYLYPP